MRNAFILKGVASLRMGELGSGRVGRERLFKAWSAFHLLILAAKYLYQRLFYAGG